MQDGEVPRRKTLPVKFACLLKGTLMVSILRRAIALVALAVGIGVAAGATPAAAATTTHKTATTHQSTQVGHTVLGKGFAQADDWWF